MMIMLFRRAAASGLVLLAVACSSGKESSPSSVKSSDNAAIVLAETTAPSQSEGSNDQLASQGLGTTIGWGDETDGCPYAHVRFKNGHCYLSGSEQTSCPAGHRLFNDGLCHYDSDWAQDGRKVYYTCPPGYRFEARDFLCHLNQ